MTNSRNKGASFEREVANLLTKDLGLKKNIRRILEQTREKHLPDLMIGRWYLECKRYGSGAEPLEAWWQQVLDATKEKGIPALVYKFDRRPIKVRVPIGAINPDLHIATIRRICSLVAVGIQMMISSNAINMLDTESIDPIIGIP